MSARTGLRACSLLSLLGWLLIALTGLLSLLPLLFPGVILLGLAAGLSNPLAATYVSEMVPAGNKGIVTSIFNCQVSPHYHLILLLFQITFGIFITNILGDLLGWFFNSIVLGVLHAAFSVAVFLLLPQTPFDLARTEKYAELQKALIKSGNPQDEALILEQVAMEEESVGYLTTVKQLNKRHLLIVLAVFILSHLSGISIVTAYLVDIFADSSALDPLVLLIVRT